MPSVLLINDNQDELAAIGFFLTQAGFGVDCADNGRDGIEIAATRQPSAILLDLSMPGMNGWEVLAALRGSYRTQHIPVIINTGWGLERRDELMGLTFGADDYLVKPVEPEILIARLKKVIRSPNQQSTNLGAAMQVFPVFQARQFKPTDNNSVFLLMPFGEVWSVRLWDQIRAISKSVGYSCRRADELFGHDILEDIWSGINEASVILADVTGRNPNVMYEVGICHTLGKNVVLLTQNPSDIPTDFQRFRHTAYTDDPQGFVSLAEVLSKFLSHFAAKNPG